jgi:hypothetical protein
MLMLALTGYGYQFRIPPFHGVEIILLQDKVNVILDNS